MNGSRATSLTFGLFVLLNAILFIRPAELFESLQVFRLYQLAILACLATTYPLVLGKLQGDSLARNPITVCVLGLLVTIVLSHLRHGSIYDARTSGYEFGKIVLYYLLLVVNLDRPARYQQFLSWLVLFTAIAASLALLQFHGYTNFPALDAYQQREIDEETGEIIVFPRLCGAGIFNDPNDVCLLLSAAIMLCIYRLTTPGGGTKRFLWCLPIVLFLAAFIETKSRGGFLSLIVGVGVLMATRLGVKKALLLGLLLSPAVLVVAGGRMTNIDVNDGTGQHRIQLWREALSLLREFPILGCGQGMLPEYTRLVAHNSYVHAFAELGLVGGSCFVGIVFLSLTLLRGLGNREALIQDDELRRFRPYLLGIVCGFCTGIISLSRVYIVPTYMVFGLVTAYLQQVQWPSRRPPASWRFDSQMAVKLAGIGLVALVTLELGSRLLVRWDG